MSAETVQLLRDPQCFIASSSSDRKGDLAGGGGGGVATSRKFGKKERRSQISFLLLSACFYCLLYMLSIYSTVSFNPVVHYEVSHSTCQVNLSSMAAGLMSPPASDTAWQLHEGCPEGQARSVCHRSSEPGTWWPASASRRNGSGPRGNRQKSFGCILCQTGIG